MRMGHPGSRMPNMGMGGPGGAMHPNMNPGMPQGGGPQGQPGMYGNPNMMSDVRMRAQSRYRLGNPNASSMRQPLPNTSMAGGPGPGVPGGAAPGGQAGMTVPQGQQSPMGGPNGGPGNMPQQMMQNPGMRQQVCRFFFT